MIQNITVIITLYKTPEKYLKNLNQYKNYKTIIFNQGNTHKISELKKILKINFKYFGSNKNIGFSKATNFLISKVKTKYFLFTQADITIDKKSIKYLLNEIKKNKNIIFAGPNFKPSEKLLKKTIQKKNLNAACMICDTAKVRKIKFFDEDYFLYWNDEDLMERVKKSPYKMIQVSKAKAVHESSKSSIENFRVKFLRSKHFKLGELLFDYKFNKLRIVKIFRQIIQSLIKLIFFTLLLNKEKIVANLGYLVGILNFLLFYIKKILQ